MAFCGFGPTSPTAPRFPGFYVATNRIILLRPRPRLALKKKKFWFPKVNLTPSTRTVSAEASLPEFSAV